MAIHKSKIPNYFMFLASISLVASGFSGVAQQNQSGSIGEYIKDSIVGTARAESYYNSTGPFGTACWNASFTNNLDPCPDPGDEFINICLKENDSTALPLYYYTSNDDVLNSYYALTLDDTNITQLPITGLLINPVFQSTTNPYLVSFSRLNYLLNLTAPAVPFGSSPILTTVDTYPIFSDVNSNSYNLSHQVAANVRMEHVNTAPTLSNLSPTNYTQVLSGASATINLPVSVDYNDAENNQANLVFELTNDNFSTILQTQTINNVTAGSTVNTSFSNLGVGEYNWRVTATETNASGNCIGYTNADPPVNLSTQDGPTAVTLTSDGSLGGSSGQLASTGQNRGIPFIAAVFSTLLGLALLLSNKMQKLIKR